MKFVKGMIAGMVIAVGATMLCNEISCQGSGKMLKQGKKMMKKIGIM